MKSNKMMINIGLQKIKLIRIHNVHNYLDSLPQVGKVFHFHQLLKLQQLNNNKPLGTLEMGVLYTKIPESIKTEIIDPYISIKDNEARISLKNNRLSGKS